MGISAFNKYLVFLSIAIGMGGCIKISNPYAIIPPGTWRATLELSLDTAEIADERSKGMLPFNFEVVYITPDSIHLIIQNDEERIVCMDISMAFDRSIAKDTIRIGIPVFGTYVKARYEEDAIEGFWYDPSRGPNYRIPFRAYHGQTYRFALPADAAYDDFDGRWKAAIGIESPNPEEDVLIISQNGNHISGTILSETGDYRYLEGNVEDNRMFLSTFDGSHAYLFEGKLLGDGTISGTYRSGNHYKTYWSASRNTQYTLADPLTLTHLRDSSARMSFALPDTKGNTVSLDDPPFQGKPKIVSVFGTWCPNCRDENDFLAEYFDKHPDSHVQVISVAFERRDSVDAVRMIENYREYFGITWPILYGGRNNKAEVAQKLGIVEKFISYPTMIFLNEDNTVYRIHTGFNGPATPAYADFLDEFNEIMAVLENQ